MESWFNVTYLDMKAHEMSGFQNLVFRYLIGCIAMEDAAFLKLPIRVFVQPLGEGGAINVSFGGINTKAVQKFAEDCKKVYGSTRIEVAPPRLGDLTNVSIER